MANIGLDFWLTQWNWEPSILIATVLITGLYLYAIGPLRKRYFPEEPVKTGQTVSFLLGIFFMFLSLVSPLDELGDSYLFSAHMVQHLVLTMIGPPLLVIGTPGWFIKPLVRNKIAFRVAKALTYPAVAFVLYNVDFWLWHAPPLYNATLENQNIHILEHLTFIVFGILNWWPMFSQSKDLPRLSIGGQVLYLYAFCFVRSRSDLLPAALRSLHCRASCMGHFCGHRSATWRAHHVGAGEHFLYRRHECAVHPLDAATRS